MDMLDGVQLQREEFDLSMYRSLMFRRVSIRMMTKLWKNKTPMKIRVFMWLVFQDKLQIGVNLKRKKCKGIQIVACVGFLEIQTMFSLVVPQQKKKNNLDLLQGGLRVGLSTKNLTGFFFPHGKPHFHYHITKIQMFSDYRAQKRQTKRVPRPGYNKNLTGYCDHQLPLDTSSYQIKFFMIFVVLWVCEIFVIR